MKNIRIQLPDGFLDEEERCGYTVSRETKELWAVELDLLDQLDRVCRENGLTYFAGAGTLLGAVRHKGFIPWDDDMDFYMLREDYDRLMELSDAFEKPYFLQNAYTEPAMARSYARLRNCETTGYTDWEKDYSVVKGIFIDIFPLDGVSGNKIKNSLQKLRAKYYRIRLRKKLAIDPKYSWKRKCWIRFCNMISTDDERTRLKTFRKRDRNLKRYSRKGTEIWGNRTLVFDCPKSRRPYSDWLDIIRVPFEFTQIPIPRNYDGMLKQQYGSYMQFPKDKSAGKMHGGLTFSADKAYYDTGRTQFP